MKHVSGPHLIFVPDWLKPGEATPWHSHNYAHNTVALAGDVIVRLRESGQVREHMLREADAVRWVLVPAGVEHSVELVSECSRAACFFSHYGPDGKPRDTYSYAADAQGAYA